MTRPSSVPIPTVISPRNPPDRPRRPGWAGRSPSHPLRTAFPRSQSKSWAKKRWLSSKPPYPPLALRSLQFVHLLIFTGTRGLFSQSLSCPRGASRVTPKWTSRIRATLRTPRRRVKRLCPSCIGLEETRACLSLISLPRYWIFFHNGSGFLLVSVEVSTFALNIEIFGSGKWVELVFARILSLVVFFWSFCDDEC